MDGEQSRARGLCTGARTWNVQRPAKEMGDWDSNVRFVYSKKKKKKRRAKYSMAQGGEVQHMEHLVWPTSQPIRTFAWPLSGAQRSLRHRAC